MASSDRNEKYTEPELRRKLKQELQDSAKGGKPGSWSARKSQLLVQAYEKRGGGYRGEKDEAATSLEAWTEQNWQTKEGDADARQEDGSTRRYLPERAWELLSDGEKRAAERKKRKGDEEGKQYVANTLAAKEARRKAMGGSGEGDGPHERSMAPTKRELYRQAQKLGVEGRSKMDKGQLERAVNRAER